MAIQLTLRHLMDRFAIRRHKYVVILQFRLNKVMEHKVQELISMANSDKAVIVTEMKVNIINMVILGSQVTHSMVLIQN